MRARIACLHCGKSNVATEDNVILHVYTRQPAFSWCEMTCDHCDEESEFFFAPGTWEDNLRAVISSGASLLTEEWVDDKTYGEYLDTWGKHLKGQDLTDYQEKEILFFAWLLNNDAPERWFDDGT